MCVTSSEEFSLMCWEWRRSMFQKVGLSSQDRGWVWSPPPEEAHRLAHPLAVAHYLPFLSFLLPLFLSENL